MEQFFLKNGPNFSQKWTKFFSKIDQIFLKNGSIFSQKWTTFSSTMTQKKWPPEAVEDLAEHPLVDAGDVVQVHVLHLLVILGDFFLVLI
jgi:hypothetical protein